MTEQLWNENWKFWLDKDSFALVWIIPAQAREINLPHDAMIEQPAYAESPNGGNTGFRDGDIYTYVKMLYASKEYEHKTVALKFEGVYMNALVYVNGQLAGKNPFGYTTFYVPLNDFLRYGEENEIRVQVRAGAMTNSRWYSGAGIYRDVYLVTGDCTYIKPEGVQICTENADDELAVIVVRTELKNRCPKPKDCILETKILDEAENEVAAERTRIVLLGGEERVMEERIALAHPELWSEDTPVLYHCSSSLHLVNKNTELDVSDNNLTTFGVRSLTVDAKRGLRVNGKTVKLRGSCIHHDSGLLGAATYEEAQYRQVKKLKEAGFNAIRMSHHPMAPAMLRACDELGVYVMDELADMWNRCKSNYDYGLYFNEWWESDAEAMVRKDYNHPSVILYSIGNEIPEIGTDHGAKMAHAISSKIKSLDSTRFTLASINGVFAAGDAVDQIVADVASNLSADEQAGGNVNDFMTLMDGHMDEIVVHPAITKRLEKACAGMDIAGYNYMTARYEPDGKDYPNRVIVGSETYPPEIARNWSEVKRLSHVIGDFTWTGWDYIGEAGVGIPAYRWGEGGFGAGFPAQLAYAGDIDITGFRRPASYYREIVFGLRKAPYITVQDPNHYGQNLIKTPWVISDSVSTWNWKGCEGKPVIVEIYATGDEVELFCNDKSLGKKSSGEQVEYRILFETIYEPGTLTAVSYENGIEIGRMDLVSAQGDAQIAVVPEEMTGEDELIFLNVTLEDENGIVVTDADRKLTLECSDAAKIMGFGTGNPKPMYNYNEGVTETFHGRAQAILMRMKSQEKITVTVRSEDGKSTEITL